MKIKLKTLPIMIFMWLITIILVVGFAGCSSPREEVYYGEFDRAELERICQEYTSSDEIKGESKTLAEFCEELNKTKAHENIRDLDKIIPLDCIKPLKAQTAFYYVGEEYGFWVVPNRYAEYHIFLFDLTWLSDGVLQTTRIDVLLSVNVKYNNKDNADTWERIGDDDTRYCLKNVNFGAVLFNENQPNYGNNGLLIQGASINYGGVFKEDGKTPLENFKVDHVFGGLRLAEYDILTSKIDLVSNVEAFKCTTENMEANHKKFIFAESKSEQSINNEYGSFTKVSYLKSSENNDIYIGQGGFAEYTVMINDTGESSRIFRQVSFDLVSIGGGIEVFNGNGELYASNEKIIFEDISYAVSDAYSDDERISVHVSPQGRQMIKIRPQYEGKYTFTLRKFLGEFIDFEMSLYDPFDEVEIYKDGLFYTAELSPYKEYKWVISNSGTELFADKEAKFIYTPTLLIENEQKQFTVSYNDKSRFSVMTDERILYKIDVNMPDGVSMELSLQSEIIETYKKSGTYEFIFQPNERYILTFDNNSQGRADCSAMLTKGDIIKFNEKRVFSLESRKVKYFLFTAPMDGNYKIECNNDNCEAEFEYMTIDYNGYSNLLQQNGYFVRIKNLGNDTEEIRLEIAVKLNAVFNKINKCNNEWVEFTPYSSRQYNLYTLNGDMTIYDSDLNEIVSNTDNELLTLNEGERYFIHFSEANEILAILDTGSLNAVQATGTPVEATADENGFVYFSFLSDKDGYYDITTNGEMIVYYGVFAKQTDLGHYIPDGGRVFIAVKVQPYATVSITLTLK